MKMSRHVMAVRLPVELEQTLIFCAKELHRTKSELVNEALTDYLEDLQDFISAKKALATSERTYTMKEIKVRHGLGS